jgi:hypothetical protein
MIQINAKPLRDYDNFLRSYAGEGEFHLPEKVFSSAVPTSFSCRFECGQTKHGQILCKCWFDDREQCRLVNSSINELFGLRGDLFYSQHSRDDAPPYPYILGSTLDQSIRVVMHPKFPFYFEAESALLFFACKLSTECRVISTPAEFKFALANFVLDEDLPSWTLNTRKVTITKAENYDEANARLQIEGGIEVTAEMSIASSSEDPHNIESVQGIAKDICRLLSLAKSCEVQWLFWEAVSDEGDVVNTYHWTPWMLPYAPLNISCDKLTPVYSDISRFINECFSAFQKECKEGNWAIEEAIDHYITAVLQQGLLELRGLSLVR